MRFPYKYVEIEGQWFVEHFDGYKKPAVPDDWLDVLVDDSWQWGSIRPDKNGKWIVGSNVSCKTWELESGQYAFPRLGPYEWLHPKRPRGKCICEVTHGMGVDEQYLGRIIMDLETYPIKCSLWIENGIFIRLGEEYELDIDLKESIIRLGYDEDVFFWGC